MEVKKKAIWFDNTNNLFTLYGSTNIGIRLDTNGLERLRIDSSGRTLIGLNSSLLSYAGLQIKGDLDNGAHICLANKTATPSSGHNIDAFVLQIMRVELGHSLV